MAPREDHQGDPRNEPVDDLIKLAVIHDGFEGETDMFKGVSRGWPQTLSSLKTLLETGTTLFD